MCIRDRVEPGQQIEFGFGRRPVFAPAFPLGLLARHSNSRRIESFVFGLWRIAVRAEAFGVGRVICVLDSTVGAAAGNKE